jgi:hypothetical protein
VKSEKTQGQAARAKIQKIKQNSSIRGPSPQQKMEILRKEKEREKVRGVTRTYENL